MKNDKTRLSASEINKFTYCPYQWYYKRYYGDRELRERYNQLEIKTSNHGANFKRGTRHHNWYYIKYRIKKVLQYVVIMTLIASIIWMVIR